MLGVKSIEDIAAFDPPNRLEYHVKECTFPIEHEIGRMDLTESGDGADVRWITRFESPIPVVGRIMGPTSCRIFNRVFKSVLEQAKTKLEA